MSTCAVCGTALIPGLAWCRQCFAPVANMRPDRSYRRTGERPDDPVITIRGGRNDTLRATGNLVIEPPQAATGFRSVPGRAARRPARSSSTVSVSLSIVSKVVITALMLGLGVGAFVGIETFRAALGEMTGAIQVVALGAYAILVAVVLWSTWRPRRASRIAQLPVRTLSPAMPRPDIARLEQGSLYGVRRNGSTGGTAHP